MGKYVIALDTDRIKQYVFATDTLKEIRGASALFDELNRTEMGKIVKTIDQYAQEIYANGGSGMFVVNSEEHAKEFIKKVKRAYYEQTITGSITGVAEVLPDDWTMESNVNEQIQRLSYKLRLAKGENPLSKTYISHSLLKDCESCGVEYAVKCDKNNDALCPSCCIKRKMNLIIKDDIEELSQHPEKLSETHSNLWHRMLFSLKEKLPLDSPEDFDQLGKLSTPKGYMGLIYADGNDMGKILEKINSLQELKTFSNVIDNAIYEAVQEAIRQHLLPETGQHILPFDILLLGGDDLVMVMTAQKAIETAITIAEKFRQYTEKYTLTKSSFIKLSQGNIPGEFLAQLEKFKNQECYLLEWKRAIGPTQFNQYKSLLLEHAEKKGKYFTLSLGVAIAHAKFPFGNLLDMAEDLLKFAKKENVKRKIKGQGIDNHGIINFQVVSASNSLNFSDDYKKTYVSEDEQPNSMKLIRTLRPYYVSDAAEVPSINALVEIIRKMKSTNFPTNKLQALYDAAFWPFNESVLQGLAIQNRLKKDQKTVLKENIKKFSPTANFTLNTIPWFGRNGECVTPFVDIAELYEFIEGGDK